MFWTELIFSQLPFYERGLKEQLPIRFLFLVLIWLTGLLANSTVGSASEFASNVQIYLTLFGTGSIILIGAYAAQRELKKTVLSFRPLLDLDDSRFERFSDRADRYFFSVIPILLLAIVLFISVSAGLGIYELPLASIIAIWNVLFIFFIDILTATGIWMCFCIWLAIFLISRSPLRIDLSQDTIIKFRGIATLALWFALFYFIAVSLGSVIPLASSHSAFVWDPLVYSALAFVLLGVLLVILPFYNIHATLLALKRRELENIETDFGLLQKQIDESSVSSSRMPPEQTISLFGRFISLQIRERRIRLAQEWPIDVTFVSKLLAMVLVPAAVRVIIWMIIGTT